MAKKNMLKPAKLTAEQSANFSSAKKITQQDKSVKLDENEAKIVEQIDIQDQKITSNDNTDNKKDIVEGQGAVTEKIEKEENEGLGLSKDIVDEKIKEALETQNPKKRRRSQIINICLLIFNLIFMVIIIRNLINSVGEDGASLSSVIETQGNKLWWLVGGVLVYCIYVFVQVLMYKVLIRDFTGKNRWWLSYDVAVIGKYYEEATPFGVGGQPMQIVKLAQSDISPGVSTSIPIIKLIMNTAVNALLALIFFIFFLPRIPLTTPFNDILLIIFEILGVIGLIITVIITLFMFIISSGTLFTRSFISGILRIGYKLKIVKNYRKTYKKLLNQVAEYKLSMSYLWKHKALLVKMLILCLLECLTYGSFAYFVVMAFLGPSGADMSPVLFLVVCITKYYICSMASSFIPLPGGTGLVEIAFIFLFGMNVGNNIVWALLAWRFLSYYLILIHGFTHEIGQIIYKFAKNNKKLKKKKVE